MTDSTGGGSSRLDRLMQYLVSDPGNTPLRRDAVNEAFQAGRLDLVQMLCTDGFSREPDSNEWAFLLGKVALAHADYAAAVHLFRRVKDRELDVSGVDYNYALALMHVGEMEAAFDTLRKGGERLLSEVPDSAKLLARAAHLNDQMSVGVQAIEKFLLEHADDAEAWGILALLSFDDDQFEKAKLAAGRALELNGNEPLACLTLGGFALESRDADVALEQFQNALFAQPNNGRAWSGLAFAQLLKLRIQDAETSFVKACEYMPDHLGTWHGLAWIQILQGNLDAAKETFEKALLLDRNFGDTHGGLAVIAAMQGRERDAELLMRRALGLNRNSYPAKYAKSLLAARQGREAEAKELMQSLIKSSPRSNSLSVAEMAERVVTSAYGASRRGKVHDE